MSNQNDHKGRGFALPMTMVGISALLILLIGLIAIVRIERRTSNKFSDSYRAELAASSALAEATTLLRGLTGTEDYLVIKRELPVSSNAQDGSPVILPRPYYYVAEPVQSGVRGEPKFQIRPLFSTAETLSPQPLSALRDETARLRKSSSAIANARIPLSADSDSSGSPSQESRDEDKLTNIAIQPWQHQPIVEWNEIYDETETLVDTERPIARYAFWIEDLEGYIDGYVAGNHSAAGIHERLDSAGLAPGIPAKILSDEGTSASTDDLIREEPVLSSMALHTLLDGSDKDEQGTDLDDKILLLRKNMATDPAFRDLAPQFGADEITAFSTTATLVNRERDPLVQPVALSARHDERTFFKRQGGQEISLDRALEQNVVLGLRGYDEQQRVPFLESISPDLRGQPKLDLNALLIDDAAGTRDFVTAFAERVRGGLPGFSDARRGGFPEDYEATLAANAKDYVDSDSTPTTEEGVYRGLDSAPLVSEYAFRLRWLGGTRTARFEAEVYLELWNMSSREVTGSLEANFATSHVAALGVNPEFALGSKETLESPETTHSLTRIGEDYRFPAMAVTLKPNEYRLLSMGKVEYSVQAGGGPESAFSASFQVMGRGTTGYRIWWNGALSDAAGGFLDQGPILLNQSQRQQVRTSIAGHSYGPNFGPTPQVNNMGDPRMSYYIRGNFQSDNAYPQNWSPQRNNIRLGIFDRGRSDQKKIYGHVFPSRWPDGGHDSEFGSDSYPRTSQDILPDDPRFLSSAPPHEEMKAPMTISNAGFFQSVTEMGNLYDPVMWDSGAGESDWERWLDITEGARASDEYGGGNTLRIGRPEHSRFENAGQSASLLLDLFSAGRVTLKGDEVAVGKVVRRRGHLNVNSASREALRAALAGNLNSDPKLGRGRPDSIDRRKRIPAVQSLTLGTPDSGSATARAADVIAEAIYEGRPYASLSELAAVETASGEKVFGNTDLYERGELIQWSDRAAEELFARIYNSGTIRSRNYRVFVVGQALSPSGVPLSTHRRVATVFVDPGVRDADGEVVPENTRVKVIHERSN